MQNLCPLCRVSRCPIGLRFTCRRYGMFDLEDMDGLVRSICWPEEYARLGEQLIPDAVVVVAGTVDRRAGSEETNLIINEIVPIAEVWSRQVRSVHVKILEAAHDARPNPFEAARTDVEAALQEARTVAALTTRATRLVATLGGEASFEKAGLDAVVETDMTRNAFVEGTPPEFMAEVFALEPGNVAVLPDAPGVILVRLDAVTAAPENEATAALTEQVGAQLDQALAQDLLAAYADDVVRRAGPQIDQRALQAVHVNFP